MDVYSSIFGELTKEVQIRIDAATELRKRLFDQNIYERYLDWDVPTIGLNFEELIGQYNLSVAAATLDSKGKEPILGTEGLETLKQKVLTHQMSYSMPIEEYRKVLQILDSRMLTDDQKTQQLINLMWNNVSTVVKSVQSKLDIIFLGALSNKGVFTFNANNNPEGGVHVVTSLEFVYPFYKTNRPFTRNQRLEYCQPAVASSEYQGFLLFYHIRFGLSIK